MTVWRPAPRIRFKALGLHWREGRLLAAKVLTDSGAVKGVRPLGGTVEFGDTAEVAVIREFREELGITVQVKGPPVYMENIFSHEGEIGHEVVAIFEVTFPSAAFADETRIEFQEANGTRWFAMDRLDLPDGPRLFPEGLKAALEKMP